MYCIICDGNSIIWMNMVILVMTGSVNYCSPAEQGVLSVPYPTSRGQQSTSSIMGGLTRNEWNDITKWFLLLPSISPPPLKPCGGCMCLWSTHILTAQTPDVSVCVAGCRGDSEVNHGYRLLCLSCAARLEMRTLLKKEPPSTHKIKKHPSARDAPVQPTF